MIWPDRFEATLVSIALEVLRYPQALSSGIREAIPAGIGVARITLCSWLAP